MLHKVLGIMTGTSCDGIDAALMMTDGENHIHRIQYIEQPFTTEFAQKLKNAGHKAHTDGCVDLNSDSITKLQQEYTQTIIDFVLYYFDTTDIELIGFHGQTILHQPTKGITIQLGLPQLLANATKTNVVFNFRQNDIQNGGQGAPLVPLYHVACVQDLPQPVTFVNIGGVSNVTYCGDPIMGFDIGTGNCISDDFTQEFFNKPFDKHGDIAASGNIHIEIAYEMAHSAVFLQPPPKSFDRNEFDISLLKTLSPVDAIATANYLTALCIVQADRFYPQKPSMRIIAGGGAKNKTLLKNIIDLSGDITVKTATEIHLNPNAIEAECFAWLAVRSKLDLPFSLPSTTGIKEPMSGGEIFYPH